MECGSVDWNAVGAIATAAATLVALAFGFREMYRQRNDQLMRGRVALAMQVPEIARLVALFDAAEEHYRQLMHQDHQRRHHALKLNQLAPAFRTSLARHPVGDFIDMPERLGYNLPTVIHALPAVAAYADQMKNRLLGAMPPEPPDPGAPASAFDEFVAVSERRESEFLSHVAEALDYTHSCSLDFRAAMKYAEENLLPLQMKNMAGRLPERFERTVGDA
ncbi:hypothetical protein LQ772_06580 [Frateuria edaphi]|uniref:hypothetical protein n=1 Tax=Frateuria edaphi TaxID=2898793 RepID=UPI001E410E05|nr:hypothetical protein [Frateuria edaphi]UGB46951.1 hypothetical protein LQ772_06580 [Frateuria edaphi]